MEEESSHNEDEKQLALKSLLFCDGEEHGIQHDDDSKIKLTENEATTDSTSDHTKAHDSSPRRSPDPNCAICLGTLENKSFTDSCFHTFCFTCLVEWSKVKAECPLCKQSFKSIVHNVRSIEDYDQYYISSKSSDTSWRAADGRNFRYRSTLTSERWTERHYCGTFEDSVEYRTHRMTYAPHSVTFPTVRNFSDHPSTSSCRRRIYENGLWVKPFGDRNAQKYRITSPEFYRQNPACTHRLNPWLNRELLALLYDSESQVTFVLELILALIMRYDIRSEEFFVHIEPYLQHRTSHFIHEFFNFASSSHDMYNYDNCATYEKLESISETSNDMFSPGSDVVAIATPSITVSSVLSPSFSVVQDLSSSDLSKKKSKRSSKRQPKLFLRRNQESNVWHSVLPTSSRSLCSTSSSDHGISSYQEFLDLGAASGPSTSGLQVPVAAQSRNTAEKSSLHETVTSGSSSDTDDCVVVDIVKPRALRTPELVNLVSSSEDESTLDTDNVHNYCVTTQGSTNCSSKRKEFQEKEEAVKVKLPKKKLRHRKESTSLSFMLNEFSNCKSFISAVQSPSSPPPHDQGISHFMPMSECKTYVENDETHNVNNLIASQELFCLDSPPQPAHESHNTCSSSSTERSQNVCESGKTFNTNKNFSKVPFSEEDLCSISSFITQTHNKKSGDTSFPVTSVEQGSDLMSNNKLSLTYNEESKEMSKEQLHHNNSSCSSSVGESAAFVVNETKARLRSVICQFPVNEQQNSRSDSSYHSSGRNKKHKHKKKKKKHGKHKHHKHSHSVSD